MKTVFRNIWQKKEFYSKNTDVHFIGHLQTNKVKYIIDSVSVIQSVDSAKLAAEVDRQAQRLGKIQDILIEVNIGDEASKGGVGRSFLRELLYEAAEMKNIKVCGLMAIPPAENAEKIFMRYASNYILTFQVKT